MRVFSTTWSRSPPVSPARSLPQPAEQCARAAPPASGSAATPCRRFWGGSVWHSWSTWARKDWTTTRDYSRTHGSSSFPRRRIGGPACSPSCSVTWPWRPLWPLGEPVSCHSIWWEGAACGRGSRCPKCGSARPRLRASYQRNADGATTATSCRFPSGITRWRE